MAKDRRDTAGELDDIPLLVNKLVLMSSTKGAQAGRDIPAEDRVTDADVDAMERRILEPVAVAAAEIRRLAAIAHDRQPYPTADAYEKVCAARAKWQQRAEQAEARVQAVAWRFIEMVPRKVQCMVAGEGDALPELLGKMSDYILAALTPRVPKLETECCAVLIATDQRFCPRCGWEVRLTPRAPEEDR